MNSRNRKPVFSKIGFLFSILCALCPPLGTSIHAAPLSPDEYLAEVRRQNSEYRSVTLSSEGAMDRSSEANLLVLPQFFGSLSWLDDERETTNPSFLGNRTKAKNYSLGIQETTPFGLNAKFSYDVTQVQITGAPLLPTSSYTTASPTIELTGSLWRNILGSEVRAQRDASRSMTLAQEHAQFFKSQVKTVEAETVYWRLALAKESVRIAQENLERTQKIKTWAQRRTNLNLGDRADFLQAEAAYQLRELELQQAEDEERNARTQFNFMRGLEHNIVNESLRSLESAFSTNSNASSKSITTLVGYSTDQANGNSYDQIPTQVPIRKDVLAAQARLNATEASIVMNEQRITPTVEFFAKYGWNGYDKTKSTATREAWGSEHPYQLFGIRFISPLALGTRNSTLRGYFKERQAAELELAQQQLTASKDWRDLNTRLQDALARFERVQKLEQTQKEKLQHERVRLDRGRTTTFHWIQFEQDYATARLAKARTQFEIISLQTQLRLFEREIK